MIDTKISGDTKTNTKREKILNNLLIESPYGKGEDFVYNGLNVVNCAFAEEAILSYDSKAIEEELEKIKDEVIIFFKTMILLQNSEKTIIRNRIYSMLDELRSLVKLKVSNS